MQEEELDEIIKQKVKERLSELDQKDVKNSKDRDEIAEKIAENVKDEKKSDFVSEFQGPVSRRQFLKLVGLGAGATVLTASGTAKWVKHGTSSANDLSGVSWAKWGSGAGEFFRSISPIFDAGGGDSGESNTGPTATFIYSPSNPSTGDTIDFDASGSSDTDGSISSYEWDWTNDSSYEGSGQTPSHSYGSSGDKTVKLRVTDNDGATDTVTNTISVSSPSYTYGTTADRPDDSVQSEGTTGKSGLEFNPNTQLEGIRVKISSMTDDGIANLYIEDSDKNTIYSKSVSDVSSGDKLDIIPGTTLSADTTYYVAADGGGSTWKPGARHLQYGWPVTSADVDIINARADGGGLPNTFTQITAIK